MLGVMEVLFALAGTFAAGDTCMSRNYSCGLTFSVAAEPNLKVGDLKTSRPAIEYWAQTTGLIAEYGYYGFPLDVIR